MKVLIIGANGFLGRNVIKKCQKKGWDFDCVYHKQRKFIPNDCNVFQVKELSDIKEEYNVVFLLAAFIPFGNLNLSNKELLETNLELPLNVLKKFKKPRIVFSSSVSVHGACSSVIDERSSFNNPNLYGLSKIGAEFVMKFSSNGQIIRFSSLYGEGMNNKTFLPQIIKNAKEQRKITVFGDGSRRQNYLHIEDAAEICMLAALAERCSTYLGVDNESYSNLEVAKIIQSYVTGCSIKFTGQDLSPSFIYNSDYTKKELNFSPNISLEDGIKELIEN